MCKPGRWLVIQFPFDILSTSALFSQSFVFLSNFQPERRPLVEVERICNLDGIGVCKGNWFVYFLIRVLRDSMREMFSFSRPTTQIHHEQTEWNKLPSFVRFSEFDLSHQLVLIFLAQAETVTGGHKGCSFCLWDKLKHELELGLRCRFAPMCLK